MKNPTDMCGGSPGDEVQTEVVPVKTSELPLLWEVAPVKFTNEGRPIWRRISSWIIVAAEIGWDLRARGRWEQRIESSQYHLRQMVPAARAPVREWNDRGGGPDRVGGSDGATSTSGGSVLRVRETYS